LKLKLKHGVSIERENAFFLKSESRKKYSNNVLYNLKYVCDIIIMPYLMQRSEKNIFSKIIYNKKFSNNVLFKDPSWS